jgi:hypothetical protein
MATTSGKSIVFDKRGDLVLEIGEEKTQCLVCSRSVARASPVFDTMLFGGFSESKPASGQWLVRLPDDGIGSFEVFLNIIHGYLDKVPDKFQRYVELVELYHIVRTADKYDLTHLLRPWAQPWLRFLRRRWGSGMSFSHEVMWVAWVLGDERLLVSQLDVAVLRMTSEGNLWDIELENSLPFLDHDCSGETGDIDGILDIMAGMSAAPEARFADTH